MTTFVLKSGLVVSGFRSWSTVVAGPALRAGSSVATTGIGVGLKKPAWVGLVGFEILIACSPLECQSIKARSWSTVGLCVEKLRNCSATGESAALPQKESWFWSKRNSPVMKGRVMSEISISRIQPHLQPNSFRVKVPYISSVVSARCLEGTWTAEWLLGQSFAIVPVESSLPQPFGNTFGTAVGSGGFCNQTGRFVGSVISLSFRESTVPGAILFPATSLVFRTRKWPASSAM